MIRRLAIRVLVGRNKLANGAFYRRSYAWNLRRNRLDEHGRPVWSYEEIARELKYKSAEACAIDVALHDTYIRESTEAQANRRKAQYRYVPNSNDPNTIDAIEEKNDDRR